MPADPVLNWLLEESQPSVRYYALTELVGRKADDPEVRSARTAIGRRGWASNILLTQKPEGYWERREPRNAREWLFFLWFPTFSSTIWKGLVLADLGLTAKRPPT
ncbi:nitrogenase subunit NifH (ATPase)-like protein, partial [mine drainage metagenome]